MNGVDPREISCYYERMFPWDWLEEFVTRRGRYEFGQFVFFFFVVGFNGSGSYPVKERMQFPSVKELKEFVLKNRVIEILMSAWYPLEMTMSTKCKWFHAPTMLERPLILDYDLTDMDFIRKVICKCQGKTLCDECWLVLVERTALPFLKMMLEDFCQFKQVLYMYSGRRGIHVHVCDERVLSWTLETRKMFMRQLLMENYDACPPMFHEVFEEYIAPQHHSDLPELTEHMKSVFAGFGGEQTIGEMLDYAKRHNDTGYERKLEEIIYWALGPRFDPGFTKDITHLIKFPGTIHRDTGNLCVPLTPGVSFKPSQAIKYTNVLLAGNPFQNMVKL